MQKQVNFLIGILSLILVISACKLGPFGDQEQPTFVAVVPASPTKAPESVPGVTATEIQAQAADTAPTETSAIEPAAATGAVESATQIPPSPSFPNPANAEWGPIVNDLNNPVGLVNAGDGSGRLFVLEQEGLIRIVEAGELLPAPFLDIRDRVGRSANEQGLLGLAFHPHYSENGYLYVNYTDLNGDTVIARFSVSSDAKLTDAASEVRLLHISQPYGNHNGGALAFGPDGYLYIGTGDGGSGGDPHGNGQSLDTLLGKILRIDVDNGNPYTIPPGNLQGEIWAYGLRNPWRLSFDRLTGDLYIGDVGQNAWEEIDFWPAGSPGGANFGWNYREGAHAFEGTPPAEVDLIEPVAEYGRSLGISVTGGVVYRGDRVPDFYGVYVYGDYGSGRVWGLWRNPDGTWQNEPLFESGANISSFGEGESGEVYLVDHKGFVFMLTEKE